MTWFHRHLKLLVATLVIGCILMTGLGVLALHNYQEYIYLTDQHHTTLQQYEVLESQLTDLEEKLRGILPYSKASGASIRLLNNFGKTHNPTWEELKSFLRADGTDEHSYYYATFICGDFAEMLHNNAEKVGIRAALVVVSFYNDIPHALNAFYTTDKGLVYVDCTGYDLGNVYPKWDSRSEIDNWDKIAYVAEGEEYGCISLDIANSPNYNFYENYLDRHEEYTQEVERYTEELGGRYFLEEPEYSYFMDWYNRLEAKRRELGGFYWKPLGIVSDIEVYW